MITYRLKFQGKLREWFGETLELEIESDGFEVTIEGDENEGFRLGECS